MVEREEAVVWDILDEVIQIGRASCQKDTGSVNEDYSFTKDCCASA